MKAMILSAGLGTRLKPLTDTMPKALVPLGGVPLLEGLIKKLQSAGYNEFVVNVHHFADQVEMFLAVNNCFGSEIAISDERDLLRETGGALRHAAPLLADSPRFLVHNVDIVSDLDYAAFTAQAESDGEAIAHLAVKDRPTSRYLLFDRDMRLVGWTNIDTAEVRSPYKDLDVSECRRLAFSGIHILSSDILPLMESRPEKFSIIDFYLEICKDRVIRGIDIAGTSIRDVGKIKDLEELK